MSPVGSRRPGELTRQLTGLDAMVLGHQGRRLSQRTRTNREDRYMLEAHRRGRMIGKMEMRIGEKANAFKSGFEKLDARYDSDPKIEALVKPYILESQRRTRAQPAGRGHRPGGEPGRAGNGGPGEMDLRQHDGLRFVPPQGQ